jgi:hypothetical protein
MKYNKYLYIDRTNNNAPLLIVAKHKPTIKNIPLSGTWVVREWYENNWIIPCYPEITLGQLRKLEFIKKI